MQLTDIATMPAANDGSTLVERHFRKAGRITRTGWVLFAVLVVPAAAWLVVAPLHSAVVASGYVKVELNRAVVQHLEGGTVQAVHVRDGQRVKAGDPILELGDVSVNADRTRLRQRLLYERAGQSRLQAEQDRRSQLVFAPDLVAASRDDAQLRDQMNKEQSLFQSRLNTLNSSLDLLNKQRATIRREMESLQAQMRSANESIAVQSRELELHTRMAKNGLVSDTSVMQLESSIADYRGRIAERAAEQARADQRLGELDLRSNQLENEYRTQSSDQLRIAMIRIQEIEQELRKATDASRRQVLTAPADGEVINLRVTSPGGVLVPREPVAEIVPDKQRLVVEAQIHPEDIGRVHKGQTAEMRFTAFTYRTTDMVKGTVSYVGGDRLIQRETGAPYYLVNVDVDPKAVSAAVKDRPDAKLQAGMPAEVFLRGEDRTPLQYLLQPLTQVVERAGRER